MDGKHVNTAIPALAILPHTTKTTPYKFHYYLRRFNQFFMGYTLANTQPSTTVGAVLLACQRPILHPSSSGVAS